MKHIKVLGTGCPSCKATIEMIQKTADEYNTAIELEKVEDLQAIIGYGVMSTPGVVVDGVVVHAGGIPRKGAVEQWLQSKL